jgi:hypothetical protein
MKVLSIILFILAIQSIGWADDAHPYSITFVQADLQDKKIILSIRTTAEDLLYFHNVKHDSAFDISSEVLSDLAVRHAALIQSAFYVVDENDIRLQSTLAKVNVSSLSKFNAINIMMLYKYPLHYTFEVALSPETKILEFHQDLEDSGVPAVSMLSVTKSGRNLVEGIEVTKHNPYKIARDALSISAPSKESFMLSYLTLTDTKISHELTLPFQLLRSFVASTTLNTQNSLSTIHDFINQNSSVVVNGINIEPEITMLDFQSSANSQSDTLLVNIRIDYSLKMLPKDVAISWESFTWQLRWFKSIINAFGEKVDHNFSRFQPTYKAERRLKTQSKKD